MFWISLIVCTSMQCQVLQENPKKFYKSEEECRARANDSMISLAKELSSLPKLQMATKCIKEEGV